MADLTRFLGPGGARQSEKKNAAALGCHPDDGLNDPTTHKEAEPNMNIISAPSSALIGDLPRVDRPCPVWCEKATEGHRWEGTFVGEDVVQRIHWSAVSPRVDFASVTITSEETAKAVPCECSTDAARAHECDLAATGPSTHQAPVVSVWADDELTPDQASQLAVWLRQAAISANRYRTATFGPGVTR